MDMQDLFQRYIWHYTNGAQDVLYPPRFDADESRSRRAYELARAEIAAGIAGAEFEWEDDWDIGSHVEQFDCYEEEPKTCELVDMVVDGEVVASLGCVDDADDAYRRIVEAELAHEWSRGKSRRAPAVIEYGDVA